MESIFPLIINTYYLYLEMIMTYLGKKKNLQATFFVTVCHACKFAENSKTNLSNSIILNTVSKNGSLQTKSRELHIFSIFQQLYLCIFLLSLYMT